MGIYTHRFYFEYGLPEVKDVQQKFIQITGLKLECAARVHLKKIMENREDIICHINQGEAEASFARTVKSEGNKSDILPNKLSINEAVFYCKGFDKIYIGEGTVQEKSFQTVFSAGVKTLYFFMALEKTMIELGGRTFNYNTYPYPEDLNVEAYLNPYHPHEREWKRIKKWNEMSDFEKNSFKNKLANED